MEASDAARSKADELGVDLATVDGTGANGNVTVSDVEKAAKAGQAETGVTPGKEVDRDAGDAGVPMLGGSPSEPQGPEDALGEGPKRGDYSDRQPEGTTHYEARPLEGGGEPVTDKKGNVLDYKPVSELVEQNPRVEDVGEVAGEKGGVTTA